MRRSIFRCGAHSRLAILALLAALLPCVLSCTPEEKANAGQVRDEASFVGGGSYGEGSQEPQQTTVNKRVSAEYPARISESNAAQASSQGMERPLQSALNDGADRASPSRQERNTRTAQNVDDDYILRNCKDYGSGRDPKCRAACPYDLNAEADDDFARNCAEIISHGLKYEALPAFSEGGRTWQLQKLTNPSKPEGPLWFVPHDNENVAFDTAIYGLVQHGGVLIAVETGGQRENQGQDPNRNFDIGSGPLCPQQKARSLQYTNAVLEPWDRVRPIIALHSNTSQGNISINKPSPMTSAYHGSGETPHKSLFRPDNTLVFVASPKRGSARTEYFKSELTRKGINVLWEHVDTSKSDCSLSNYAALKGIENYFNVEVAHSNKRGSPSEAAQRTIVDIIMALPPDKLNVARR